MFSAEIPEGSQLAFSEKLDLFTKPVADVGLTDVSWVSYRPINQYCSQSSIDFLINNQGQSFLDFDKSYMNITLRVLQGDGKLIPPYTPGQTDVPDVSRCSIINCLYLALWSQIKVELNSTLISNGNDSLAYINYIEALLTNSISAKTSQMQTMGYYEDSASFMNDTDPIRGGMLFFNYIA